MTGAMRTALSVLISALAIPGTAVAQQTGDPNHEWCDQGNGGDRRTNRYCEVREFTVAAVAGALTVDAGRNGGITVEGWNQNSIRVLARVQAWSRDDDAEDMVRAISVDTGRTISADIPGSGRGRGAAVSFRLSVPGASDLSLETLNGSISITDVVGDIEFRARNGAIRLDDVGGDVQGRTTNGRVSVTLGGSEWDGRGLDVETTNGRVTLRVPEGFRADLTIGTVNGRFETDIPITVQGRLNRRRLTTELNGGGPAIRVVTTNGRVHLRGL